MTPGPIWSFSSAACVTSCHPPANSTNLEAFPLLFLLLAFQPTFIVCWMKDRLQGQRCAWVGSGDSTLAEGEYSEALGTADTPGVWSLIEATGSAQVLLALSGWICPVCALLLTF